MGEDSRKQTAPRELSPGFGTSSLCWKRQVTKPILLPRSLLLTAENDMDLALHLAEECHRKPSGPGANKNLGDEEAVGLQSLVGGILNSRVWVVLGSYRSSITAKYHPQTIWFTLTLTFYLSNYLGRLSINVFFKSVLTCVYSYSRVINEFEPPTTHDNFNFLVLVTSGGLLVKNSSRKLHCKLWMCPFPPRMDSQEHCFQSKFLGAMDTDSAQWRDAEGIPRGVCIFTEDVCTIIVQVQISCSSHRAYK